MKAQYEVLTWMEYGWDNVWHLDEELQAFSSEEEALAAVKEHIADCLEAYEDGFLDDVPGVEDFMIVNKFDTVH